MSKTVIGLDADGNSVKVSQDARTRHEFILGPTGYGKSRYLDFRIRQDIENGYGVCLIDPDGDDPKSVFKSTLRWLKAEGYWHEKESRRARQIRVLDISSREFVTALNPFYVPADTNDPPEPWITAGSLFSIFERVWKQDFSQFPTIQNLLPAIFVLLMEAKLSLADAPVLLGSDDAAKVLRQKLLDNAQDQVAKQELLNAHLKAPREFEPQVMGPRNRISRFTNTPRVRQMFSGGGNPLDLRRVMDEREILLVNLAPDDYHSADKHVAQIVGTWLIHEFYRQARTRRTRPPSPFYLYIDEASDYLTDDIPDILFKSRKRGLSLIMAVQTLQQLRDAGDTIYSAVSEQTNIMTVFGGLKKDAEEMVDHLFDLDVETPVQITARPMPNGKKIITELVSRSHTDGQGQTDTATQSTADTVVHSRARVTGRGSSEGRNTAGSESQTTLPLAGPDGNPLVSVNIGAVVSELFAESFMESEIEGTAEGRTDGQSVSRARSQNCSDTIGLSQTLVDEVETMFSSVHSLEGVRYQAAVLLRRLPRRHFFMTVDREPAQRLIVPQVDELDVSENKLDDLIRQLYLADPATVTVAEAKQHLRYPV